MIVVSKTGVLVSGTLGKDAEYKLVGARETPRLRFSVLYGKEEAADENGRHKGKYIDVNVWGGAATKMQGMLLKDDAVLACGRLSERTDDQGRVWRSIDTYGEVWPGMAWLMEQQGAAPVPAAPDISQNCTDFEPVQSDEDLPF